MNKENFIENLKLININIDDNQLNLLEKYFKILEEYNKTTNLTRIITKEDVYLKHFYDSLTISKVVDLNNIKNLLDFGSGAGFPGIVIKIVYPDINLTLLDSNNKKTKFLEFLCAELNIDAIVINDRAENYLKQKINSFDLVVARAVANMRVLSELSIPFVKENGYFVAMKGNSKDELKEAIDTIHILKSEIKEIVEFNLLDKSFRSIICIEKKQKTKLSNLRQYDQILKKPLVKYN